MNHREPPHLSAGTRRALRCLSLLLLPAFAPHAAHSLPRSRPEEGAAAGAPGSEPVPYLPALGGSLPLRFQKAAPPPDLATRPPAAAPPVPALTPTETTVAQANAAAAQPASTHAPSEAPAAEAKPKETPPPAKPAPPAILPDDTRPSIRPEDFLPYFQLPGSAKGPGDVRVIVPGTFTPPAPGTLPPSSATYTQTPK